MFGRNEIFAFALVGDGVDVVHAWPYANSYEAVGRRYVICMKSIVELIRREEKKQRLFINYVQSKPLKKYHRNTSPNTSATSQMYEITFIALM